MHSSVLDVVVPVHRFSSQGHASAPSFNISGLDSPEGLITALSNQASAVFEALFSSHSHSVTRRGRLAEPQCLPKAVHAWARRQILRPRQPIDQVKEPKHHSRGAGPVPVRRRKWSHLNSLHRETAKQCSTIVSKRVAELRSIGLTGSETYGQFASLQVKVSGSYTDADSRSLRERCSFRQQLHTHRACSRT